MDDDTIMSTAPGKLSEEQKRRRVEILQQQQMSDAQLVMVDSTRLGSMVQSRAIAVHDLFLAEHADLSPSSRLRQAALKQEVDKLKNKDKPKNSLLDCRAETLSNNDLKARIKLLKNTKGVYPGHNGTYDKKALKRSKRANLAPHEETRRQIWLAMDGEDIDVDDSFAYTGGKNDIELRLTTRNLSSEQQVRRRLLCELPEFKVHLGSRKVSASPPPSISDESQTGDGDDVDFAKMKLDEYIENYWIPGDSVTDGMSEKQLALANPKDLTDGGVATRKMLRQRATDSKYRSKRNLDPSYRKERSLQRNDQRKRKQ